MSHHIGLVGRKVNGEEVLCLTVGTCHAVPIDKEWNVEAHNA